MQETNGSMAGTSDEGELDGVYECRGWLEDGSSDSEQFAWRVAMTCYVAVLLLLAVTALPFYVCIPYVSHCRPSTLCSNKHKHLY